MVSRSHAASWNGTDFCVLCGASMSSSNSTAAPEESNAGAGRVVVGWRWTVSLVSLVAAAQPELNDCCYKKDEAISSSD
jgi:hypothetical protein